MPDAFDRNAGRAADEAAGCLGGIGLLLFAGLASAFTSPPIPDILSRMRQLSYPPAIDAPVDEWVCPTCNQKTEALQLVCFNCGSLIMEDKKNDAGGVQGSAIFSMSIGGVMLLMYLMFLLSGEATELVTAIFLVLGGILFFSGMIASERQRKNK